MKDKINRNVERAAMRLNADLLNGNRSDVFAAFNAMSGPLAAAVILEMMAELVGAWTDEAASLQRLLLARLTDDQERQWVVLRDVAALADDE